MLPSSLVAHIFHLPCRAEYSLKMIVHTNNLNRLGLDLADGSGQPILHALAGMWSHEIESCEAAACTVFDWCSSMRRWRWRETLG